MAACMRAAFTAVAALLLSACLVTPGRFDSALDIRADRSFTFRYQGEVIASDMGGNISGLDEPGEANPHGEDSAYGDVRLWQTSDGPQSNSGGNRPNSRGNREERFDTKAGNDDQRMRAMAAALTREKGFKAARYVGNRRFEIDYAIEGVLDHSFLFPFNIDAQIVLPFVAVELRGNDRVRVKAPGFSNGFDKSQGPPTGGPGDDAAKALNGTFTLTTDAEIVSQNQEDGVQATDRGHQIVWTVTPLTSEAPAATLRLRK
ncbi:MAG: hypothetical protein AB7E60_01425 [Sphingobium sp.]